MTTLLEFIIPIWIEYNIFFYASLISSLAALVRISKYNLFQQFILSFFCSLVIGITVKNFTDFNKELIFVVACLGGYYSSDLLQEIREVVQGIGELIQSLIRQKFRLKK
jgi:hypothetical protein